MAISRWVFDRSLPPPRQYLGGGFYDADIVRIAQAYGRNSADCEIRERLDADPHPPESEWYQVPDPRPTVAAIRAALQGAASLAEFKAALLQLIQRVT